MKKGEIMIEGYWIPVLHSHLPFVKHPKYDYFLEEHWLFEAITECYIPLLGNLKKLNDEGVDFRLTVSITPPLAEMLADEHLTKKYLAYLDRLIELGGKEIKRTKGDEEFEPLAHYYKNLFEQSKEFFLGFLGGNVLSGYRFFSDLGKLEIITCGATHGFLPLMSVNKRAVEVQIEVAVESHKKHFGKAPKGIWLPECAFYDGLDEILKSNGIDFFVVDSHALIYSKPTANYGVYAPAYTPHLSCAFARDNESAKQVWSSKEGYPGDVNYRDFYRDIGYDLKKSYIKDYINPDGVRVFTGYKYHKITGEGDHKEAYKPLTAKKKTVIHAKNFHHNRQKQIENLAKQMDRPPMILSPYDAELFGHWWFEGPEFLYHLFKEIDEHKVFKVTTPKEYLEMFPTNQQVNPQPSSWGDGGYYDVWLNPTNDWIYRHLHQMADVMCKFANRYKSEKNRLRCGVLNQMARELLLAQSSDWAFLMTTGTAVEYSTKRTKEHISNFNLLQKMIEENEIDEEKLKTMEIKNSIFDFLDFRIYGDMSL